MLKDKVDLAYTLYGMRKLASLPFRLIGNAAVPSLLFFVMFAIVFLFGEGQEKVFGIKPGTTVEKITSILALILVAVSLIGLFTTVMRSAALFSSGLSEREFEIKAASIWTVIGRAWPSFAGFAVFNFAFGAGITVMYSVNLRQTINTAATADLNVYADSFLENLLEPFTNPILYGIALLSAVYFGFYAKKAIVLCESFMVAMDLRSEKEVSVVSAVTDDKKSFVALAAIPHVILGVFFLVARAASPDADVTQLMHRADNFVSAILWSLVFCAIIAFIIMVHAAFVSVIWMAASERSGMLSLTELDRFGNSGRPPVARTSSQRNTATQQNGPASFGQRRFGDLQNKSSQPRFGQK